MRPVKIKNCVSSQSAVLLERPALLHLRETLLLADQAQEVGDDLRSRRDDVLAAQRVIVHDLLGQAPDRPDRVGLEERLGDTGEDRPDHLEHALGDRLDEREQVGQERVDVAADDGDVAGDTLRDRELAPGEPDVALDAGKRQAVRLEAFPEEREDFAQDVDRLQDRPDRSAERAEGQQLFDELQRGGWDRLVRERVRAGDVGEEDVAGDRADLVADGVEDRVQVRDHVRDGGGQVRDKGGDDRRVVVG